MCLLSAFLVNPTKTERKEKRKKRKRKRAAAAAAEDVLTDERPITGWVSTLCAGRNSALMAFTDSK